MEDVTPKDVPFKGEDEDATAAVNPTAIFGKETVKSLQKIPLLKTRYGMEMHYVLL
jgi:hypothetical protein